jgi:Raf kinase inhibitor-like YbhB/YbcL family protein
MELKSSAFEHGEEIPRRFSCEGGDHSPPLSWSGLPPGTRALALICEDSDAPLKKFTHWLVYDIPSGEAGLTEGVPEDAVLRSGAKQGKNDFGRLGYGGPCPPNGPFHRYFFTLYALDSPLMLDAAAGRKEVDHAIESHVIARAQLMGRYRKVRLTTFVRSLFRRPGAHTSP